MPQLNDKYPGYTSSRSVPTCSTSLPPTLNGVELQDSLLDLSKLSPEEQRKVCQRPADELKKKEKEEAEAAAREGASPGWTRRTT